MEKRIQAQSSQKQNARNKKVLFNHYYYLLFTFYAFHFEKSRKPIGTCRALYRKKIKEPFSQRGYMPFIIYEASFNKFCRCFATKRWKIRIFKIALHGESPLETQIPDDLFVLSHLYEKSLAKARDNLHMKNARLAFFFAFNFAAASSAHAHNLANAFIVSRSFSFLVCIFLIYSMREEGEIFRFCWAQHLSFFFTANYLELQTREPLNKHNSIRKPFTLIIIER